MKSIKEKAEEVFPFKEHDSLETKLQRQKMRLCYEHGANYVLDAIQTYVITEHYNLEYIIEQLKK